MLRTRNESNDGKVKTPVFAAAAVTALIGVELESEWGIGVGRISRGCQYWRISPDVLSDENNNTIRDNLVPRVVCAISIDRNPDLSPNPDPDLIHVNVAR